MLFGAGMAVIIFIKISGPMSDSVSSGEVLGQRSLLCAHSRAMCGSTDGSTVVTKLRTGRMEALMFVRNTAYNRRSGAPRFTVGPRIGDRGQVRNGKSDRRTLAP